MTKPPGAGPRGLPTERGRRVLRGRAPSACGGAPGDLDRCEAQESDGRLPRTAGGSDASAWAGDKRGRFPGEFLIHGWRALTASESGYDRAPSRGSGGLPVEPVRCRNVLVNAGAQLRPGSAHPTPRPRTGAAPRRRWGAAAPGRLIVGQTSVIDRPGCGGSAERCAQPRGPRITVGRLGRREVLTVARPSDPTSRRGSESSRKEPCGA